MQISIKGETEKVVKAVAEKLHLTPRQFLIQALENELGRKFQEDEIRVSGLNESNSGSGDTGIGF